MFSHLLRLVKILSELTFLNRIFCKNDYPKNFIDKCFKKFLDNIHHVKEKAPIVERKCLLLDLPYLGVISLQTCKTTASI